MVGRSRAPSEYLKGATMKKDSKEQQLKLHNRLDENALTTNQGVKVSDTDNSLKAGPRGPTLIEDFHFREKMTHFDHERIPERVVHARGSGAHGYFQCYESLADLTKAKFLQDPSKKTPVFVRFSTVVGFRGSADTVRDVRGFATKFYTDDGNYDLVGNNMPVFFIQDAMKFPDLVHSIKPEPHNEYPQASAAHANFWDFISLMPESAHMIMWVLSDRALPRSYSTMDGFGVHTFRFVNEKGEGRFVKFHWRPKAGVLSLAWDETQKIAGKDPDFNRKQLWELIEKGHYPEYELCVQVVEEKDEFKFGVDLLDPTKIIPEEDVPLKPIGKMVLDRNPDNFFAETEQVAFHPGHVVPGIDFTNDPLLQGRLFSYLDTQLIRLGGPNFSEIPINRPLTEVSNNQRDGYMRQTINKGKTNYFPNSRGGGCPFLAGIKDAYNHFAEKIEGQKVRTRSESFGDHFSQATLFWNSMSDSEKRRIVEAAQFELGKVDSREIRQRVVNDIFNPIDHEFACKVASGIGVEAPRHVAIENHGRKSPSLSLEHRKTGDVTGFKVAILAMDGVDGESVSQLKHDLKKVGAEAEVISDSASPLKTIGGDSLEVDKTFSTTAAVLYDGLIIPSGRASLDALGEIDEATEFVMETYKHQKTIAVIADGIEYLRNLGFNDELLVQPGVLSTKDKDSRVNGLSFSERIIDSLGEHRFWGRVSFAKSRTQMHLKPEVPAKEIRAPH